MSDSAEQSILDDPIWEYVVASKLQPYLPAVRKWWEKYDQLKIMGTGVFPFECDDEGLEVPPGLNIRVTSTPVRSPIKNVQAFPFVPTAFLQIIGVPGGVNRMVERVCHNGLKLEEFVIIEKHNLPSTYQKGQFVAFVPEDILNGSKELGKYVYLTLQELVSLAQGKCVTSVKWKCGRYLE